MKSLFTLIIFATVISSCETNSKSYLTEIPAGYDALNTTPKPLECPVTANGNSPKYCKDIFTSTHSMGNNSDKFYLKVLHPKGLEVKVICIPFHSISVGHHGRDSIDRVLGFIEVIKEADYDENTPKVTKVFEILNEKHLEIANSANGQIHNTFHLISVLPKESHFDGVSYHVAAHTIEDPRG